MRRPPHSTAPQALTPPADVPAAARRVPAAPRRPLAVVGDDACAAGPPGLPPARSALPAPSAPSAPRLPRCLIMPLVLEARATTARAARLAASVTLQAQRLGAVAEVAAHGIGRALQTVTERRALAAPAVQARPESFAHGTVAYPDRLASLGDGLEIRTSHTSPAHREV